MIRVSLSVAGLLLAVGSAAPAFAGHYDKTKTVTWDIGDGRGGVVGGPAPAQQSNWIGLTHALADDKHQPADKDTDAGAGPAYPRVINDDLVRGGAVANDRPHPQAPQPKYKTGGFDQTTVNAAGSTLYTYSALAFASHADADAFGEVKVKRTDVGATKQITGTLTISGNTSAATPPVAHAPETSYAQATSGVGLELKGKITAADWSNAAGKRGKVRIAGGQTSVTATGESRESGSDENATSGATDPIVATYTDEATGAVLGSNVVYRDSYVATGRGEVHWNPLSGITLVAPAGSTASVEIETPSAWVVNPFNGTVGIVAGVFTATGAFAALPWNVSTVGGDVTATLSPGALSDVLDLDLNLASLPGSVGDVGASLDSDLDGWTEELRTVTPTPGSVALLAMGGVLAARRRRA